jgi:hypothetical protein
MPLIAQMCAALHPAQPIAMTSIPAEALGSWVALRLHPVPFFVPFHFELSLENLGLV